MSRILLRIAFDGSGYAGWQLQPHDLTIQAVLEAQLSTLYHAPIRVHGSSRTDTGVHAIGMAVHYDAPHDIPCDGVVRALQKMLPFDIRVRSAQVVDDEFHARFSAVGKTYQYILTDKPLLPWLQRYALSVYQLTNYDAMQTALKMIEGKHDFVGLSCRGSIEMADTRRTIFHTSLTSHGDLWVVRMTGDGFMYKMVRSIVGVLCDVGTGRYAPEMMHTFLQAPARTHQVKTAPPQGLFLEEVYYDEQRMLDNKKAQIAVSQGCFGDEKI